MSAAVEVETGIDRNEIQRALAQYEGIPGRVSVMYLQEQGIAPTYASYATTPAELDQAVRDIVKADLTDEPLGIYVRGTTIGEDVAARGVSDDTVVWIAFRSDLDLGKPGGPPTWPDLFAAFDLAKLPTPTYWQHSGGGFYPTWQLAEPIAHGADAEALAADIEAELRRAWKAAGYTSGVDSCRDAARVWRLAGSVHRKNRAAPITSTIGKVSNEVLTFAELRERVPVRERAATWDGRRTDPRFATADAFEKTYRESLEGCKAGGRDHFRHSFFLAARNAHRMVAIGQRTEDEIRDELLELVQTFWPGAGFNGDDQQHMYDALNNGLDRGGSVGALASPWELTNVRHLPERRLYNAGEYGGGEYDEPGTAVERIVIEGEVYDPAAAAQAAEDAEVQAELRRRRIKRLADEAERPPTLSIADGLVWDDELADIPAPEMAVGGLLPERGVGFLGGPSGAYKTFAAVQLAAALAYGIPAMGHHEFTVKRTRKVFYLAGEGASGAALRVRATRHHGGITATRRLVVYPRAVNLTSEREAAELLEVMLANEIEHVFVDTFRQNTQGIDENSNSETTIVLGRLLAWRDEHGIGSTLLDHTNKTAGALADLGGAGAKRANADYVLMVDLPGISRDADQQRILRTAKLKDQPDGKEWPVKLDRVDAILDADGCASAALVVGEVGMTEAPFGRLRNVAWWQHEMDQQLPEAVVALAGPGADAAREAFRVLRFVDDDLGATMGNLVRAVNERPLSEGYSDSTVRRGMRLLSTAGVVHAQGVRYFLAPEFRPS